MRKCELLDKAVWTNAETEEYFKDQFKHTTVCKLRKLAREKFNGNVKFSRKLVRSESILNALGTTRAKEKEIYGIRSLQN